MKQMNQTEGAKTLEDERTFPSHFTQAANLSQMAETMIFQQMSDLTDTLVDYKELLMMYSCAMKCVQTKFEVLDQEFNIRYKRNPIHTIRTRLKSNSSIVEKAMRKDIPFSLGSITEQIQDIAGVRVICSYVDDIYLLSDALTSQSDVTLLEKKDYISVPKPNGYRSLHLIVAVPVYFANQTETLKVEVQIRTIAMDLWASLEHQLKYKRGIKNQEEIVARLSDCANIIAKVDAEMQSIRQTMAEAEDAPVEQELLDKLRKLELPI